MGGSLGMAAGEAIVTGMMTAGRAQASLRHVRRLGRRAHAGGRPLADAAAAHHRRRRGAARGEAALYRRPHQSDHRRRHRLLRHAGRRPHRRAGRAHRLRRPARHRADHPREAARGLPARRVPARARHGRHGRPPPQAARDDRPALPPARRRGAARRPAGAGHAPPPSRSLHRLHRTLRRMDRSTAILERFSRAHPREIDLSLDRIERPDGRARPSRAPPAAGHPCRRHQRQGLDHRLPARHAGGGRQVASTSTPRRISSASTSASASARRAAAASSTRTSWSRR